jgi:hypothetical protein
MDKMFQQTKGVTEKMIAEGLNFPDCIKTILTRGFTCGLEICLTVELSDEDRTVTYQEEKDKPYQHDNYDGKFKLTDYKIINYTIGNFNDLKDLLGLT